MNEHSRIYIAGHRGLVGSAIVRELERRGFSNLLTRTRQELDLMDESAVNTFFDRERPEYVFLAAARVGGIKANNDYPAWFIHDNLKVQMNVIHAAHQFDVKKLLFLGSSCIYPKFANQPIREESLLAGQLEPTNEWYAVAKIAGIKMCQAYRRQYGDDFICAMPTNLYGVNDNYSSWSHVIPGMIRRFHEAKMKQAEEVLCWGTGTPRREFLYSDDLAKACVLLMEKYSDEQIVNVGYGSDVTIQQLAETVAKTVGFNGRIRWDTSKPDGTPRKLLDSWRLFAMGWRPEVMLADGLRMAYDDFLGEQETDCKAA